MSYAIKIFLGAAIAVAASEIAKRWPAWGALLVALPLTSMIAMGLLYYDTQDNAKVAEFARAIPPLVLPTFIFFYGFSFLVDRGLGFVMAMVLATMLMLSAYGLFIYATRSGS